MNPEGGYTRTYRRLWSNPVFPTKQHAAVFAWMKDTAQWRDGRYATKFGPVELRVGELLIAERTLAEEFGLHRNSLRALLQRMVGDGMIELIRDRCAHRAGTVVRVVNYKAYQGIADTSEASASRNEAVSRTEGGPKKDPSGTKNNKGNSTKEDKGDFDGDTRAHASGTKESQDLLLGPTVVPAEAIQIITAFDAARDVAFGQAVEPRFPTVTDRIDAQRWLKAGAEAGMTPREVVELCANIFQSVHRKLAGKSGPVPRTLAFHNQDFADAIVRRNRPVPVGHVADRDRPGASRPLTATEMRAQLRAQMGASL